jgi:hypothetical protein
VIITINMLASEVTRMRAARANKWTRVKMAVNQSDLVVARKSAVIYSGSQSKVPVGGISNLIFKGGEMVLDVATPNNAQQIEDFDTFAAIGEKVCEDVVANNVCSEGCPESKYWTDNHGGNKTCEELGLVMSVNPLKESEKVVGYEYIRAPGDKFEDISCCGDGEPEMWTCVECGTVGCEDCGDA